MAKTDWKAKAKSLKKKLGKMADVVTPKPAKPISPLAPKDRSEERRVGKEC